ncbi:hypothetical protein MAPG_05039 [Magnaporthiopsis poae ATCC 64411]|uniref:Uncharacterized protein n=1 Tax=Magnaporthiopsis poae (strain ATCC 64411 / 73-15) TaxID=644358 RepID=A0A0C4DYC1_MAGP6|nr:hypothetical protein MAPG_05039 [Magnaporthiopsis poae ATCC 64411]
MLEDSSKSHVVGTDISPRLKRAREAWGSTTAPRTIFTETEMAPANTEMDAGLRLRRARTARGVRDLDRDALQRRREQDPLQPRSDDDDKNAPKSPDSPTSPASPSSSSTAPPQATAPPAVAPPAAAPPAVAPPAVALPLPPPLPPPPRRPGNLAPPPPPPPAQPVQTTSISSTTSRPTNPPVSTVPLPSLTSRVPPALTISTQPGQTTNPAPPPPPAVLNPVDLSTSRSSASSVPTAPSSSSSTSVVVSVVPTPSSAGDSTTSLPFKETAIAVPTSSPSSAPVSVSTAEPQYQLGPTPAVPGQPLTSAGSGVSEPQSTDNVLSPVAAPAVAGDGGAGLHAGIAVGSVAGTALVSALMFYAYKVYKRRQDSDYLSKPYTSGSNGSRDAPTGGSVAVVTGVPAGAGATTGLQSGQTFATFDPKTNSQIMNDMFAAVYAAENGQAGMYSSDYNSMASAGYPSEKKMEVQQVQYEAQEQYQDQDQEFQTQEQGGRGTIASWIRGTKTPTFPRASWSSRFTAPSWARSSTASTMRASAAFPEGFRPASPLPPSGGVSFRSVVYGTEQQQPQQPSAPAPVAFRSVDYSAEQQQPSSSGPISFRSVDYSADGQKPPIPPVPFPSGQYQPFGPALRRPSASLQKLRTSGDELAATAAEKEQLAFEVSPLSPESEAITEKPTIASPASPKTRRESGWGRE